jgi:hypothetical protein
LLKQQASIAVYRLPIKENKLPFSVFFRLQKTNGSVPFTVNSVFRPDDFP